MAARHRLLLGLGLATLLVGAPGAQAGTTPSRSAGLSSLQQTLTSELQSAGGVGSALVVDLKTGATLFSAAPDVPRLPASVEKLYTTTTALIDFGAKARFQTGIYGVGHLTAKGIWDGTLYLRGGGDPTFGDAAFDQAAYGTGATVQSLAADLIHRGVHGVTGRIVGDESYFDSRRGTPATHYQPDLEYEGELSGLSFDAGFESSSELALQPQPAMFATQALVAALGVDHFKLPKHLVVATGVTPTAAKLVGDVESPTLATLMLLTNSPSDNFFAETLLKDIGADFGRAGTTAAGARVVRATITKDFGFTPQLNDGSGLSRSDHTTATQVVTLLERMQTNSVFTGSLAIAGVRGTMQYEMVGTRAVDNCRGKTGTLSDTANLVGYCTARNGDLLTFAFLLNRQADAEAGHMVEDQMGEALADYSP